jgi:UMF1 family MFS transporter
MAALCDRTGQTRLYLAFFTAVCVSAMALIGAVSAWWAVLLCLAVANIAYQNALTFYPALLPSVAPADRMGLVSGLGVGLGYLGTILAIALVFALKGLGFSGLTLALAVSFLVLALPCLLFVSDRRDVPREPFAWSMISERFTAVTRTLGDIAHDPVARLFFLGNFFLVDVLNTAIFYFGAFTEDVFGAQAARGELALFGQEVSASTFKLIAGLLFCVLALGSGVGVGWLADRTHPLRAMRLSGWCLLIGLVGGIYFGGRSPLLFLIAMCGIGGIGLAGIWAAGRQLLVLLAPPEKLGEYAGFYGITSKLSVVGSTTFALMADWSRRDLQTSAEVSEGIARMLSQKEALTLQLLQLVVGLVLLYGLRPQDLPKPNGAALESSL